jgi:hypothetical protein
MRIMAIACRPDVAELRPVKSITSFAKSNFVSRFKLIWAVQSFAKTIFLLFQKLCFASRIPLLHEQLCREVDRRSAGLEAGAGCATGGE